MSEMSVIDNIRLTFLYIEFYSMGKTWVYPESYIPYNIFRYIVKGKAEFCIDGEEIIVKENQIVYIPQGCRMSCRALSESFEFYSLRFTTSVFYEGEDVLKEYYGIPRIIENEGEDYYFKEICKWVKKDSWVKKCFVRGYLDLLIGVVTFMNAWNNYLWAKVIMSDNTTQTMPMLISNLISGYVTDYGMLMLAVLITTIPTAIVFFALQKHFVEGITGSVK